MWDGSSGSLDPCQKPWYPRKDLLIPHMFSFAKRKEHDDPLDTVWHRRFGPVVGSMAVFILEVLQIVIISAAIIVPIRYFLVQPFYVKGASMEPNFYDREYLIIDELTFRMREPERGEIIVFRYPRDPSQFFIKRLVGLPGRRSRSPAARSSSTTTRIRTDRSSTRSFTSEARSRRERKRSRSAPTNISSWETIATKASTREASDRLASPRSSAASGCAGCRCRA